MSALQDRIKEFYKRLGASPRASTADEALEQLSRTLDEVEDDLSGIPKKSPPPPPGMPDGRMYPPLPDFLTRHPDGSITARTRGHVIEIGSDGGVTIRNKKTGSTEFTK
jgi:hypothetical protein